MEKETFYMIYMEGESNPTYKHLSLESAEIEAKRLTELFNKKTYVLCTIKSVQLNRFIINDCRPDDELPF